MHSKIAVAAAALAAVSGVSAAGQAIIKNECSSNVYLWTVSNTPGTMQTIAPGSTYSEDYQLNPDGGGISMKLAMEPDLSGPITQYEYTVAGMLWYDISNINGFPFMDSGLTLIPSISSCRSMVCPAGVAFCSAAYNAPDDNEATAACDASTDTTLVLCSNQQGTTPQSSASAVASGHTFKAAVQQTTAPAPTTTAAAATTTAAPATTAPPAQVENPDVVYTTFVTEFYTVWEKRGAAPEPTQVAKREEAQPIHKKRAAHRHHFNRHAAVEDSN